MYNITFGLGKKKEAVEDVDQPFIKWSFAAV
jgi:hypothetical protein